MQNFNKNNIHPKPTSRKSKQAHRGRPKEFDKRIDTAREKVFDASLSLELCQTQQSQAIEAIQGIGKDYHPVEKEIGTPQTTEVVAQKLKEHFATIETVANEAQLGQRCQASITKAKKAMTDMLATISFFWMTVTAKIEALGLTLEQEQFLRQHLIPGIYLDIVSNKTTPSVLKRQIRQRAEVLLAPVQDINSPLMELDTKELEALEQVAKECAQLFQRSSYGKEGRNGQLALHHHSLHRFRSRKLACHSKSITTISNEKMERRQQNVSKEPNHESCLSIGNSKLIYPDNLLQSVLNPSRKIMCCLKQHKKWPKR